MLLLECREIINTWTHACWMLLAIPGTVLLCLRTRGQPAKQLSLLVFGCSLTFCYGCSMIFHAVRDPVWIDLFSRLDHIGIYLLIAGSFTPPAVTLLRDPWRIGILGFVWSMALVGSAARILHGKPPLACLTSLYLLMGWSGLLCYVEMARRLTHRGMALILIGGALYSIGALINVFHWPAPWPGVFGHHELFHLFVMAGSLAHYYFMFWHVIPFEDRALHVGRLAWRGILADTKLHRHDHPPIRQYAPRDTTSHEAIRGTC